jgi:hypothetical protein
MLKSERFSFAIRRTALSPAAAFAQTFFSKTLEILPASRSVLWRRRWASSAAAGASWAPKESVAARRASVTVCGQTRQRHVAQQHNAALTCTKAADRSSSLTFWRCWASRAPAERQLGQTCWLARLKLLNGCSGDGGSRRRVAVPASPPPPPLARGRSSTCICSTWRF